MPAEYPAGPGRGASVPVTRVLVALLIALGLAAPRAAHAIPAFARRYETSCQTCHVAFPKLTPFGEAFRRNAYHFPDGGDALSEKEEPLPLGNDAQAERWPRAVFPGQLPGRLPLSMTLAGKVAFGNAFEGHGAEAGHDEAAHDETATGDMADMDMDAHDGAENTLQLSSALEQVGVRAGGVLGEHVAFFNAINVGGHVAIEAERANVIFTPLAKPSALLVKVGRFEPDLHGVTIHRGLTGHMLRLTTSTVGDATFAVEPYHDGLELSGVGARRIGWTLGVVENATPGVYVAKDGFARAEVKVGGMPLDGSGGVAGTAAWRERSVTLGASGWYGRSEIEEGQEDPFLRLGADVHATFDDVSLDVVAVRERHEAPIGGSPVGRSLDVLYAELTWVALPVVFPTLRFEGSRVAGEAFTTAPTWLGLGVVNAVVRPNVLLRAEVGVGADEGATPGFRFAGLSYSAAF